MVNHFLDIGFDINDDESYQSIVESIWNKAEWLETAYGFYGAYRDRSGAELWMQIDKENNLKIMHPYFTGKGNWRVGFTDILPDDDNPMNVGCHAWLSPRDENDPETGFYPFYFEVPDYVLSPQEAVPGMGTIQLIAFSEGLNYYDSEETLYESQTSKMKYAAQSFIPMGLFPNANYSTETSAQITGSILEWEKKTNNLSGLEFYWLFIETYGGQIDVVSDPKYFQKEPQIGGIIKGKFWLTGRILKPEVKEVKKKGFWGKLFG